MPFTISVTGHFSAAHMLRLYDGSMEPVHGHNWRVKVTVGGQLDAIGVVMDFHALERKLQRVVGPMHNGCLNDLAAFERVNPSAENIAVHIAGALRLPSRVRLLEVEVWETAENSARYVPEAASPPAAD